MSKVIACMLAFSGAPMDEPPETLEPSQPSEKKAWDEKLGLSAKITKAARTLDYAIRHNNGIKEQNILRLLLPIGIEADQIDGIWLATVNSFVEDRGRAAHTSAETSRTQQPPDPYTEVKTVEGLLVGFRDIDRAINKLMPL